MYTRLTSIIQTTLADIDEKRYGVGLDIKSFDTADQSWLIRVAFSIQAENLQFTEIEQINSFHYSIEHFMTFRLMNRLINETLTPSHNSRVCETPCQSSPQTTV